MKPLAILGVTLALVTATAATTLAHVDSLGQSDAYWQQVAAESAAAGAQEPSGGSAPEDLVASGALSLLLLAFGIALALDLATTPASFWATRADEASRGPTTAQPGEAAEIMSEGPIRTVAVVPPSARGEGRRVLRVAAAIAFGALLIGRLHASDRGDDRRPAPSAIRQEQSR